MLSWLKARLFPVRNPNNFEDWVSNQFGKRLFNTFFKSYTEKVWGMSCREISADWAAQRIKGLSLGSAIKNALFPQRHNGRQNEGDQDADQFLQVSAQRSGDDVGSVRRKNEGDGRPDRDGLQGYRLRLRRSSRALEPCDIKDQNGAKHSLEAEHVISSAPMRELARGTFSTPFPSGRREAADSLKYRDFLTVMLILKERNMFDDNWIYIHDPSVKVGRIQNFRSWSPEMVPDPDKACYGLEYFCFEHDGLWDSIRCGPDRARENAS